MINSLSIAQLVEHCHAEARNYLQTGQSNEGYCFELFRRAMIEQDQTAWKAVYAQYESLVSAWVYNYSRFPATGEAVDFFVNEAFARLWQYGTKSGKTEEFNGLGKYLKYLKLCVGSAIENYLRQQRKDALIAAVALESFDRPTAAADEQAERAMRFSKLEQILEETVQDERERLVAQESWVYNLAPRQIQARHPASFATPGEINQIKRNIIKRLQRHPKLKDVGIEGTKNKENAFFI